MAVKYFDKWEFQRALSFVESNPIEARARYEEYLKKYPNDYSTYPYYASILVTLGEFDKAEKVLDYVKYTVSMDFHFSNELNKIKILEQNIYYVILRLLSYQEKYDELYHFCLKYSQYIKKNDMNHIFFYCKKQKGMLIPDIRDTNSYLFRQIIEYRESDFLQHIEKHLADYNINIDNPNKNIFIPNFPINEIISEIKKYIPSDKRLFSGFFDDVYVFKYNNCGRDNNKSVDYFKVICFHNTKNFITMFPVADCQNLPYVDLNYLIHDSINTKVKRKSQIDKFNQKYKLN